MEQRLRTILYGNSSFSLISSLLCIALSELIAKSMGLEGKASQEILSIGIGVLLFAFYVFYVARQNPLKKNMVKSVIVMDFSWVLGSLIVIIFNPFGLNVMGLLTVMVVATFVLLFGIFQTITLKKLLK